MSNTVLITGGNRGIGFQLCQQLSQRGDTVITTCRDTNTELENLDVEVIQNIDVSDPSSIRDMKEQLGNRKLDILINSAGILSRETLDDLDFERILKQFEVNTLGPLRITHALLGNLNANSKVAIITSRVGSIEDNGSGGIYGYRISKVAANMVGKNLSLDLADKDIPVILLHPGLVATEMTQNQGISPTDSAKGLIARIDDLSMATTGQFWHAEGYQLPW